MRILFTFIGGSGHFEPLVPVARAVEALGHRVAFGCGPAMVARVAEAGFTVFTLGTGTAGPPERLPLRPLDAAREDAEFQVRFARRGARQRVPLTIALCRTWQPDGLVCDETDFGAMVAAEVSGIPYASVLVMAAGSFVRPALVAEPLHELRTAHGLPPDPTLAMLSRHLVLAPFPPGFRDPAYPLPTTAYSFRPPLPEAVEAMPPPWATALPGAPVIYFTLGTVFNMESGDLFTRVLAGLGTLPVNVLVTVGHAINPAEFGPQPAGIQIEHYIAQQKLLPHCDLVVSHGGSGSVAGALAYGLPMLLIPMGADQPLNAARAVQLGIGRMLDPLAATSADVREAVTALLADPGYRHAAGKLRDEFAALPGPAYAAALIEQLGAG